MVVSGSRHGASRGVPPQACSVVFVDVNGGGVDVHHVNGRHVWLAQEHGISRLACTGTGNTSLSQRHHCAGPLSSSESADTLIEVALMVSGHLKHVGGSC